jgi:hypothetical protein
MRKYRAVLGVDLMSIVCYKTLLVQIKYQTHQTGAIAVKIKILRKDVLGYVFFLLLAIACLAIGIRMLAEHRAASGAFGIVLGGLLALVPTSMVLRKT